MARKKYCLSHQHQYEAANSSALKTSTISFSLLMTRYNALSDIIAQAVSLSGLGSFLLENSFINLSGVLVCAPVRKKVTLTLPSASLFT